MKRLLLALTLCLPIAVTAQNVWETPNATGNPDEKYLAGAVPEENGQVVFHTVLTAPGKSAGEIYSRLNNFLSALTKGEEQTEQSHVTMTDDKDHVIVGKYQETLVFKRKPLVLDQTLLLYQIVVRCSDGQADVTMNRISYIYDEERGGGIYRAEEWINDRYGLNRKKTKLARVSGKFRRKTIDRKDYLFRKMQEVIE